MLRPSNPQVKRNFVCRHRARHRTS